MRVNSSAHCGLTASNAARLGLLTPCKKCCPDRYYASLIDTSSYLVVSLSLVLSFLSCS